MSARTLRHALLLAAVAGGVAAAAPAACTVFDGLTPQQTFLESDTDAARLCANVFHCKNDGVELTKAIAMSTGVPVSDQSFSLCMTWLVSPLPPNRPGIDVQRQMIQCMSDRAKQGTGCSGIEDCAWVLPVDPADAGCDGGELDLCRDAKTVIDCHANRRLKCDSPRFQSTPESSCGIGKGGRARCTWFGCTPSQTVCKDDVSTACDANLEVSIECASEGLACDTTAMGECHGSSDCNDPPGHSSCSVDKAEVNICNGAQVSQFNCTAIGEECADDGMGLAYCKNSANTACDPFMPAKCNGSGLDVCVAGKSSHVDCQSLGFSCVNEACQ